MANYSNLIASIRQVIVPDNHANEIGGGDVLNSLLSMISALGAGYQFMGVATIDTSPGTPDYNVLYIAGAGTYPNFGGTIVASGELGVFMYNGTWQYKKIAIGSGGGGGSQVAWTQIQQSGTQIAKITIDGVETNIFAPTSGGGSGLTNVRINGNLGTVADNVADLGSGFIKTSATAGLLKNDGTVDTNSYVTIGTTQTITGQKTFNISPLPGGTITGNYSNIAFGSNAARWRSLYGVELVLGSDSASALGAISLTYNRESDNVAYTSPIFGYSRSRNAIYFGGVDFSDKGGNFEIYANSSISFRIKRSDSTTHDVVMDVQRGKVVTTNFVASGYVQTPVIKNSSGIDRISISSNVTISANTIIGGNLYPDAANRTLGITGNPWKNMYIASNGGFYFGAFGGSTTVPFIIIDEDLNFGTALTTRSDQTPKRHRIYGSSIQGIVQSKLGTGTYAIFDAKYNSTAAIYEIAPTVDGSAASGDVNLGNPSYRWNRLYARAWYPTTSASADAPHIEYVAAVGSTPGYFKIVGNVMTTGYHTVGGINPNTGDTSINGNLIPSNDAYYSLGSSGMRFKDAYFSGNIGSAGAPVNEIFVTTIGEDASPGRVTNIYAENIKSANTLTITKLATTTIAFTMPSSSGGSATIAALTSALANIKAGQVYTLVDSTNNYNLRLTGWRMISSSQHEIYTGAFKFVQNSTTPNNWTVTKL